MLAAILPFVGFLPVVLLWSNSTYQQTGNLLGVAWGCVSVPFGLIGAAILVLVARGLRKRDVRARNFALFCSYFAIGLAVLATITMITAIPVVAFMVPGQALLVALGVWSVVVLRRPEIRAEFRET